MPDLRMPAFVPHIYSAQVLVYNPDDVKDPPQSFGDLLDPKWKGKVGVVSHGGDRGCMHGGEPAAERQPPRISTRRRHSC